MKTGRKGNRDSQGSGQAPSQEARSPRLEARRLQSHVIATAGQLRQSRDFTLLPTLPPRCDYPSHVCITGLLEPRNGESSLGKGPGRISAVTCLLLASPSPLRPSHGCCPDSRAVLQWLWGEAGASGPLGRSGSKRVQRIKGCLQKIASVGAQRRLAAH